MPAGSASLLTKPRSNVRSVPQPASSRKASAGLLRDATPSVRAKSLPEPRGRTPRRGRADSSSRMSPLTASWITPSPPSTSTVSYSLACAAISVASPRRVVSRISQLTTGASPVFRARSTSMAPSRPRPLCAAGFAMTSVLPQVGSMPAVPIFPSPIHLRQRYHGKRGGSTPCCLGLVMGMRWIDLRPSSYMSAYRFEAVRETLVQPCYRMPGRPYPRLPCVSAILWATAMAPVARANDTAAMTKGSCGDTSYTKPAASDPATMPADLAD